MSKSSSSTTINILFVGSSPSRRSGSIAKSHSNSHPNQGFSYSTFKSISTTFYQPLQLLSAFRAIMCPCIQPIPESDRFRPEGALREVWQGWVCYCMYGTTQLRVEKINKICIAQAKSPEALDLSNYLGKRKWRQLLRIYRTLIYKELKSK